jgi:hypothetical protein
MSQQLHYSLFIPMPGLGTDHCSLPVSLSPPCRPPIPSSSNKASLPSSHAHPEFTNSTPTPPIHILLTQKTYSLPLRSTFISNPPKAKIQPNPTPLISNGPTRILLHRPEGSAGLFLHRPEGAARLLLCGYEECVSPQISSVHGWREG